MPEQQPVQTAAFKKIVLLILDGFGVASAARGNAITSAKTPNLNSLLSQYPALTLQASGPLVGLPWGEMGNSEVGHLNIGAGRIVGQDLPRITASIQSGEFFRNPIFLQACEHVKKNNSKLHLLGMVSPGGVHSHEEHLYALLGVAAEQEIKNVFIHMITDGRDTREKIALESLEKLHTKITQIGVGKIATVAGRFYAMDRGGHWAQTELTYQALVSGLGETATSALDCIATNYAKGILDEMIPPTVIMEKGAPVATVAAGDAVVFFNFRQDRATQMTIAFVAPERMNLEPKHPKIENLFFATMTHYADDLHVPVAYGPIIIDDDLPTVIANAGLKQFHCAETEKYAHVTSFFHGGNLDPVKGEERIIVQSPSNSRNYSDAPEMSVEKISGTLIDKITRTDTSFFVANFANGDMVGHTGDLASAIKAVEAMDEQIGKIAAATLGVAGCLIITADHGNCEQMINAQGEIDKDHTTAPVPLLVIGAPFKKPVLERISYGSLAAMMPEGALSDIAPTILELFGLAKPKLMTGISLVQQLKISAGLVRKE